MTTTNYVTSNTAGVDFNQTYTVPQTYYPETANPPFALGTQADGTTGTKWVFVKATAAIALGDVVQITSAYNASSVATSTALFGDLIGVADAKAIASGDYGWVLVKGTAAHINVEGSCAINIQLATTATAGVIDDAITTGNVKISGIIITSTNTTTTVAAKAGVLDNPIVSTAY